MDRFDNGNARHLVVLSDGAIVKDGLLAWWKHNEGSGAVLTDYQEGRNGTIRNPGATFWANKAPDGSPIGTYNAVNQDVNGIGQALALIGAVPITLVAAIYTASIAQAELKCIISKRDTSQNGENYNLYQDDIDKDELTFRYTSAVAVFHGYRTTNLKLIVNTWHIITVRFVFGTPGSIVIYDGTTPLAGAWVAGDGSAGAQDTSNGYTHIGSMDSSNPPDDSGNIRLWNGRLGDVLLYNKALSVDEVAQNYSALRSRYGL